MTRWLQFNRLVIGALLIFQNSLADDQAPSVKVPESLNPCSSIPLEISGGTPPYSVSIVKADNPGGNALQSFVTQKAANLSLGSGVISGTVVTFQVKDSKGKTALSGQTSVSSQADCPPLAAGPGPNNLASNETSGTPGPNQTGGGDAGTAASANANATNTPPANNTAPAGMLPPNSTANATDSTATAALPGNGAPNATANSTADGSSAPANSNATALDPAGSPPKAADSPANKTQFPSTPSSNTRNSSNKTSPVNKPTSSAYQSAPKSAASRSSLWTEQRSALIAHGIFLGLVATGIA